MRAILTCLFAFHLQFKLRDIIFTTCPFLCVCQFLDFLAVVANGKMSLTSLMSCYCCCFCLSTCWRERFLTKSFLFFCVCVCVLGLACVCLTTGCKETEKNGTSFQAADEACAANPSLRNGGSNSKFSTGTSFLDSRQQSRPDYYHMFVFLFFPFLVSRRRTPKEFCRDDWGSSPSGIVRFGPRRFSGHSGQSQRQRPLD